VATPARREPGKSAPRCVYVHRPFTLKCFRNRYKSQSGPAAQVVGTKGIV
jgi:hypothetical protein